MSSESLNLKISTGPILNLMDSSLQEDNNLVHQKGIPISKTNSFSIDSILKSGKNMETEDSSNHDSDYYCEDTNGHQDETIEIESISSVASNNDRVEYTDDIEDSQFGGRGQVDNCRVQVFEKNRMHVVATSRGGEFRGSSGGDAMASVLRPFPMYSSLSVQPLLTASGCSSKTTIVFVMIVLRLFHMKLLILGAWLTKNKQTMCIIFQLLTMDNFACQTCSRLLWEIPLL